MTDLLVVAVGWVGSGLLVVSILQTRIERLRRLNLAACAILVAYNVWIASWPMVAMNAVLVIINLVNLVRLRSRRSVDRVPRTGTASVRLQGDDGEQLRAES